MPVWDMEQIAASRMESRRQTACRPAGIRRRSAQPVRGRRGRRPSRDHPRRRPARAARALSHALRAARRTRSSRPMAAMSTSRRATAGSRSTICGTCDGGRGARRHQHAQRRGVERRPLRHGRQLPAAHAGGARCSRPDAAQGHRRARRAAARARASPPCTTPGRAAASSSRSRTSPSCGRSLHRPARAGLRGLVHDYRAGEALADGGPFPVRRTRLDEYLDDFFFDPSYAYVIGAARDGGKGQVVNLDVRRKIADVDLPGLPHLGSGISWERDGRPVLATPNLKEGVVSVIDMKSWTDGQADPDAGPGLLPAQPREHPLRLGRRAQQPAQGRAAGDRQAHAGSGADPASRAGQERGPRRVHPRRALRAGQSLGDGWRARSSTTRRPWRRSSACP